MYRGPIIDSDVHHTWRSDEEIIEYLPKRWREFVFLPGDGRRNSIHPSGLSYPHPRGVNKRLDTYPPAGGPPGSDYATLRKQLLDPFRIEAAILDFDVGMNAALTNPYFAHAVVQAINDWTVDCWLDGIDDPRVYGAVLVPSQLPDEAAKEIRRVGKHPKIAEALLTWNGLGKPFGHPLYHPIYDACQEMGLPVAIHGQGGEVSGGVAATAAGGNPNSRLEFHTLLLQPTMHHLASFLVHGVFEKFPRLKLLIIETGVVWVPWLMWSLDRHYRLLRHESDLIRRLPSEYFREHVRLTTQPLEVTPHADQLLELLESFGGMEDILCFASDYPHWDADSPKYISSRLPQSWLPKVYYENARELYGLSSVITAETTVN